MQLERPFTMREFQRMFGHIFGEVNKQHYSDDKLMRCFFEVMGATTEVARKDRREDFRIYLPRVFSWTNAIANRFEINLQTALWDKYPGVCSYCLRDRDCICGPEQPVVPNKEEILRRLRRERKGREPILVTEHQALHKKLYAWQNERILPIQIVAHLTEEAAEVSRELRYNNLSGAAGEIADVFSWIFATATRLGLDVADIVWERYPFECEKCHCVQCQCKQPVYEV